MRRTSSIWVAIFIALGLGACSGGQTPIESLRAIPEEHLFYPGAQQLGRLGEEGGPGIEGSRVPMSGYRLGSGDGPHDIVAWYRRELQARGWTELSTSAPTSDEQSAYGWSRGELSYRVGILAPEASDDFETVFDIRIYASGER